MCAVRLHYHLYPLTSQIVRFPQLPGHNPDLLPQEDFFPSYMYIYVTFIFYQHFNLSSTGFIRS